VVPLRIGRPVTGSVLPLVIVIVVEMVIDVPAATADEVDREHDRHHYRKQDRVPGVGKDSHARRLGSRTAPAKRPPG
jgi:hypothetical protein